MPKVSICIPTLNTKPYLQERFETIFRQTYSEWELVVIDGYSEDGSWEYLNKFTKLSNVHLEQYPRGLYESLNRCIDLSCGEYVYIATSDDTMAPDLLEKLVSALDEHPECDIAHCPLRSIDEQGRSLGDAWYSESLFARSAPKLLHKKHIRKAPFDGLLHLTGDTVYTSLTQILIRKSLFSKIGFFRTDVGSIADFGWDMKASLVAETIHVPDTWGGWRRHSLQATSAVNLFSALHRNNISLMMRDAIEYSKSSLPKKLISLLETKGSDYFLKKKNFELELFSVGSSPKRALFIILEIIRGSVIAKEYLAWRLGLKSDWLCSDLETIQKWIHSVGIENSCYEVSRSV